MQLGDVFPDFTAQSNLGEIKFYDWLDNSWAIFCSHPADYTPVCTSELGRMAHLMPEFQKRKVKVCALSCNSVLDHQGWVKDVCSYSKFMADKWPFHIIADEKRELAVKLRMLDPEEKDAEGLPLTCRAVFFIGPDKKLKASMLIPATTGRNFDEVLRILDSLQLTYTNRVATPVDWKVGDAVMIQPSVTAEEAAKLFPKGFETKQVPSKKGYIRVTPQPNM